MHTSSHNGTIVFDIHTLLTHLLFLVEMVLIKGYVSGDVFPIIQKMERFTQNATTPDMATII